MNPDEVQITLDRDVAIALLVAAEYFLQSPSTYQISLAVGIGYPAGSDELADHVDAIRELRAAVNVGQDYIRAALIK